MEKPGKKRKEPPQDLDAGAGCGGGDVPGEPGARPPPKRMRLGDPDWITPFCWMCRNPEKKGIWGRIAASVAALAVPTNLAADGGGGGGGGG
jgi:hypothetical protein